MDIPILQKLEVAHTLWELRLYLEMVGAKSCEVSSNTSCFCWYCELLKSLTAVFSKCAFS